MDHYNRKYILKLDGDTYETFEDKGCALDIKFDVTFPRGNGGLCRFGRVSVLGLSQDKRKKYLDLSALCRGDATAKRLKVDLYAGYYDVGRLVRIINGYAYSATIQPPPEMWLSLEVQETKPGGGQLAPFTKLVGSLPYKIGQLAEELISNFKDPDGRTIHFVDLSSGVGNQTVEKFGSGGEYTLNSAIVAINEMSKDWVVVLRENQLFAYDASRDKSPPGMTEVSGDTGLLSVSGIDCNNAKITTFLDEQDPKHSKLKLTSKLNPQANGTYQIIEKRFWGHFHGNEWYTQYSCTNKQS